LLLFFFLFKNEFVEFELTLEIDDFLPDGKFFAFKFSLNPLLELRKALLLLLLTF
jgi:hypothetical protein